MLILAWFVLPASHAAFGQSPVAGEALEAKSSFFVELGGSGGLYSFNYDRRLSKRASLRLGFTAMPFFVNLTGGPLMLNYLVGGRGHYLEAGAGVLYLCVEDNLPSLFSGGDGDSAGVEYTLSPAASLGYRYQPPGGGFFLRIAYTPLLTPEEGYRHWGGVSIGTTW